MSFMIALVLFIVGNFSAITQWSVVQSLQAVANRLADVVTQVQSQERPQVLTKTNTPQVRDEFRPTRRNLDSSNNLKVFGARGYTSTIHPPHLALILAS
jgi:hypothetical protein